MKDLTPDRTTQLEILAAMEEMAEELLCMSPDPSELSAEEQALRPRPAV